MTVPYFWIGLGFAILCLASAIAGMWIKDGRVTFAACMVSLFGMCATAACYLSEAK